MTENKNIPDEDKTTSFEVDSTTQMPIGEGEDSGATELLPELNFDPADQPSAFDPRVTGESDATETENNAGEPEVFAAAPAQNEPAQAEHIPGETPGASSLFEDSRHQEDPFADTGFASQRPAFQPPLENEDEDRSVKFGLLTWALTLIAIGALIISMPWWHMFNWPLIGTVGLTVMGLIMLITAAIASVKEKKSKMW
ncbi:hypothetical protein [Actinomyces sp. S4-C9]|uniref:hypothetical protein n=1 Tax=Actinomyces sp. S4-C9 TaxID=1219581 RepID=UPI00050DBAF8|nr:hypothetical protein [Actinomyces sp. S4-C9]KGE99528.1 hypothetical protein HMPREF1628_08510 [Actinomyces sp. S4-C9]